MMSFYSNSWHRHHVAAVVVIVGVPVIIHGLLRGEFFAVADTWALHSAGNPGIILNIAKIGQLVVRVGPAICLAFLSLATALKEAFFAKPSLPVVSVSAVTPEHEKAFVTHLSILLQLGEIQLMEQVCWLLCRINFGQFCGHFEEGRFRL